MNNNFKKIINQSGVIPYFIQDEETKVVLITSMESRLWTIPKGLIEKNMLSEESAAKEAFEEAGVKGTVSKTIFSEYFYEKWASTYHVDIYLLEVNNILEKWDEMKTRQRKIVGITEALRMIRTDQLEILKKFSKYIDNN